MGSTSGFLWGLFLGLIGLIVVLASPNKKPSMYSRINSIIDEADKAIFKNEIEKGKDLLQDAFYHLTKVPRSTATQSIKLKIYEKLEFIDQSELVKELQEKELKESAKINLIQADQKKVDNRDTMIGAIAILVILVIIALIKAF